MIILHNGLLRRLAFYDSAPLLHIGHKNVEMYNRKLHFVVGQDSGHKEQQERSSDVLAENVFIMSIFL